MNRKDRRAHKFGHWSKYRSWYQNPTEYFGIAAEIDAAFWSNEDTDPFRYLLWDYTH